MGPASVYRVRPGRSPRGRPSHPTQAQRTQRKSKENRNAKIAKERKERKGEQEGIHTSDQNVFVPLRVFVVRCTVFLRALCVVIRFLYLSRHLGFVPVAQSEPG